VFEVAMSNTSRTQQAHDSSDKNDSSGKKDRAAGRPGPMEVLRQARAQFRELTGLTAESVSSLERTEDGWTIEIEVLELSRVPDTMSLLASYQVELSVDGELAGYRRVRRYERGRADSQRGGGSS
jgi:hypothetical protein